MSDFAIPERPETLAIQREELKSGKRHVMVYKGGVGPRPPDGFSATRVGMDTYHFNPEVHTPDTIRRAIADNTIGQHLRLGDTTKEEAMAGGDPMAIVERTPEGHEVRAAAGSSMTAGGQLDHFMRTKAAQNQVRIEHPAETLRKRLA